MRKGVVKILDQRIQIGQMDRLLFHALIPLAYRKRHLALTHITAEDRVAPVQRTLRLFQDLVEILLTAAKAGGAKKEDAFAVQLLQKVQSAFVSVCRFVLWKDNAFFKRLGKRLDGRMADKLLRDGRVRLKDCKSAKGKTYNATVLLSTEPDGRSKFSLEFEGGC